MSITAATANLLWGRARGLFSKCRRDLAPLIDGQAGLAGFQAHITANSAGGPRYDATLNAKQRDDYTNLILLCGSCHAEIDNDKFKETFTVALLHAIKADHEQACTERLTINDETRAIRGDVLSNAVDLIVQGLHLERWDEWTAQILGPSPYRWPRWSRCRIELRPAVEAVLWPDDAVSLEISSKMLVDAVIALNYTFCQHSRYDGEVDAFVCESIEIMLDNYRGPSDDIEIERKLMHWDETVELGFVHLAKCVNWFADAVREHVSPRFRIRPGAFLAEPSKFERRANGVYKFTLQEQARLVERGYIQPGRGDPWELVQTSWLKTPTADYAAPDET